MFATTPTKTMYIVAKGWIFSSLDERRDQGRSWWRSLKFVLGCHWLGDGCAINAIIIKNNGLQRLYNMDTAFYHPYAVFAQYLDQLYFKLAPKSEQSRVSTCYFYSFLSRMELSLACVFIAQLKIVSLRSTARSFTKLHLPTCLQTGQEERSKLQWSACPTTTLK